jgi:hypothetical protein
MADHFVLPPWDDRSLHHNSIGPEGAKALAEALLVNCSLASLS